MHPSEKIIENKGFSKIKFTLGVHHSTQVQGVVDLIMLSMQHEKHYQGFIYIQRREDTR
jgi:hypothetical protein